VWGSLRLTPIISVNINTNLLPWFLVKIKNINVIKHVTHKAKLTWLTTYQQSLEVLLTVRYRWFFILNALLTRDSTMFFRFLAKGKAQTWPSMSSEIQISLVSKAFKVKNHPYLIVSNTFKDCRYVVSHVSFASSNYESHVWSHLCFDFCQKPEKHGTSSRVKMAIPWPFFS